VKTKPAPKQGVEQADYTAATAEAAVKAGDAPVALIIPHGFGKSNFVWRTRSAAATIQLLKDSSDMVAPQVITGLLQKVAMTRCPTSWRSRDRSTWMSMPGDLLRNSGRESRPGWHNCGSGKAPRTPAVNRLRRRIPMRACPLR